MLVVRQPDGTLTHVPEWMTLPTAGSAEICDSPCFPLAVLRDLRLTADAALEPIPVGRSDTGRALIFQDFPKI
jgi:hypothetical protein